MLNRLKVHRVLWLAIGILAVAASLAGILTKARIYDQVVETGLIPGTYGQDLISLAAGVLLVLLASVATEWSVKKHVTALGLLGYLFYAYGIFTMERVYNSWYLVYLAIFTLSFWSIAYAVASLRQDILPNVRISKPVRITSLLIALLQPLVFYPLWTSALLGLMRTHDRIEFLYSIYILDLCFIMPAFFVLAYLLFKRRGAGYLLSPIIFILGFTLIFSLVVSELVKPLFGMAATSGSLVPPLALSLLFLLAAVLHLKKMDITHAQIP